MGVTDHGPQLVLIGPPHVGKTTIGKSVARRLGWSFVDTDREVVREHGPITEIFAQHGEGRFRELELRAVSRALTRVDVVIALGGGAPVQPGVTRLLEVHRPGRVVVFLDVESAVMRGRLVHTASRPLLAEGFSAWERLYRQREAEYRRLATHTVDTSHLSMRATARRVAELAREAAGQSKEEEA